VSTCCSRWAHVDIDARVPEIATPVSLAVILGVLVVVTVASLLKTRRDPGAKAHPGSLRASETPETSEASDREDL
jgi:tellurite resistance protein TerC